MKIEELAKGQKQPDGTYVGIKFTKETNQRIKDFMKQYDIPNPIKSDSFHCTVIYSRKYLPTFEAQGEINPPWKGEATRMDIFTSASNTNCLVIVFDCPEVIARHHEIMDNYGATYDYPEYKAHVTLSYDCGDFDPNSIANLKDAVGEIEIDNEYTENLNLNWAKSNTKD